MVIHNYILVLLVYYALAEVFAGKETALSQYVLLPFVVFIIPFGYLNVESFIHMYDGWQFQTAIFYGGSVVSDSNSYDFIICQRLIGKNRFQKNYIHGNDLSGYVIIFIYFYTNRNTYVSYFDIYKNLDRISGNIYRSRKISAALSGAIAGTCFICEPYRQKCVA